MTSFHQLKVANTKIKAGNKTEKRETLRLTQRTVLPIEENNKNETRMGQKEV